jgi:Zn-dependent M28 family amino/carboxypeptidase
MKRAAFFWTALFLFWALCCGLGDMALSEENMVQNKQKTIKLLRDHLTMLTHTIGERSVGRPENLEKTAAYIQGQFEGFGLQVQRQTYDFRGMQVSNIVASFQHSNNPVTHYVLGAHYDSVAGTVGADDNASAVAVLLETARGLQLGRVGEGNGLKITFVAFALEEPPAYGTRYMGSRVYADGATKESMDIDGMICLEMVGYTCREPGCQRYPFPLKFLGYPKEGSFIGIVGNVSSLGFTRKLLKSFKNNPNLPVVSLTVPFDGWIMPAVRLSDHASFWSKGYRAVMLTDTAFFRNPHYHLPSDTMQTLDFSYMAELVQNLISFFCPTQ